MKVDELINAAMAMDMTGKDCPIPLANMMCGPMEYVPRHVVKNLLNKAADQAIKSELALSAALQERDEARQKLALSLPMDKVRAALQKLHSKALTDYMDFMQNYDEDEGVESMLAANSMTVQIVANELRIDLSAPSATPTPPEE